MYENLYTRAALTFNEKETGVDIDPKMGGITRRTRISLWRVKAYSGRINNQLGALHLTTWTRRALALALGLFVSNLWAQDNPITLEFLPGLASDGYDPVAAMVLARDGALYGSTEKGGFNDQGTLYRVVPGATPSISTVYSFGEETAFPYAPMVAASDGQLYGVTGVRKGLYRLTPGSSPVVRARPDLT